MHKKIFLLAFALCVSTRLAATPIVPVSYTYAASPWGYWDDTGGQLTDGLYNGLIPGVSLATPDAYNWVGWSGNVPSVTFDFGATVTIQSLTIDAALWTPAGVYLPGQVTINADTFNVTPDGYTGFANMDRAILNFGGSWTGSTLTLNFTAAPNTGAWTFLDEVSFDGHVGGNSVPDSGATLAYLMLAFAILVLVAKRNRKVESLSAWN